MLASLTEREIVLAIIGTQIQADPLRMCILAF